METTENTSTKFKINIGSIILLSIVVISLGTAAYFYLNRNKQPEETTVQSSQTPADPQDSEAALNAALALAQQQPNVSNLINLGLAYYNNGKFEEAIQINQQVLLLDSNNYLALNNLCATYNNLERYEEAFFWGKRAIAVDAGNQLAKGNTDYAKKQIERIAQLKESVTTNATKYNTLSLGLYHYKRKEFKEAIDVFKKGLKIAPNNATLLNNTCASYCELGEWSKAIPYCEEALKLEPNHKLAKGNLQWAKDRASGKYN